ncbi:MAG: ArsR/SmtB family transcription factor [Lysobacterales bacterium]
MELVNATELLRTLADASRVRLLALLVDEELTVAELSTITRLKQPRVSTHLSKLKEAGLVADRRSGVAAYYRATAEDWPAATQSLWESLRAHTRDAVLVEDHARRRQVLDARLGASSWADTVAGDMERHYSPGRSWEASMRACLELLELGDVLDVASGDGALAQLLAPRTRTLTCVDLSERVVAAGQARLADQPQARVVQGDMHALPLPDASVDLVLLLQALPYSDRPAQVLAEAARVLRAGGRLLLTCLDRHQHRTVVAPFGHRNLGFGADELATLLAQAGFARPRISVGGVESRPPHFKVWVATACAGNSSD